MAKNIYDTLVQIDASNKEYYLNNYNNFLEEIDQTDEKIKAIFTQSEFSDKSAKVIADELKIKVIKDDLALLFLLLNIHNYIHKSLLIQEFFQQFQYLLKQLIF